MMQAAQPPIHWTTYAALIVSVLSVVGTFVYVWFTYHIMKWAVRSSAAATKMAGLAVAARDDELVRYAVELADIIHVAVRAFGAVAMSTESVDANSFLMAARSSFDPIRAVNERMRNALRGDIPLELLPRMRAVCARVDALVDEIDTVDLEGHDPYWGTPPETPAAFKRRISQAMGALNLIMSSAAKYYEDIAGPTARVRFQAEYFLRL
jgi:hypothetical protein